MDKIKVSYHTPTTNSPPLNPYASASPDPRKANITAARSLRTWTRNGVPTTSPPRTSRLHSRLYTGRIPMNELHDHLLVRNLDISARGKLSPDSILLAAALSRPHRHGAGGDDNYIYE